MDTHEMKLKTSNYMFLYKEDSAGTENLKTAELFFLQAEQFRHSYIESSKLKLNSNIKQIIKKN